MSRLSRNPEERNLNGKVTEVHKAHRSILTDAFGRRHTYLRLSITERCNLRCTYCMPEEGIPLAEKDKLLSLEEIEALSRLFVELGVRKIRVTGGEPLVRAGVGELCGRLRQIEGLHTLALSTNGVLLAQKARGLRDNGVSHINVSLDTLSVDTFRTLARRDRLKDVLNGIYEAKRMGFESLKINVVVMRGVNEHELPDFVRLADALEVHVRFIEFMPFLGNKWSPELVVPLGEMKRIISSQFTLHPRETDPASDGPATEFSIQGGRGVIGFISSLSEPSCSGCSRLRLTADGMFRVCLFAQDAVDLKSLVRSGVSRLEMEKAIGEAVSGKWWRRPELNELVGKGDRAMVAIGG